MTLGYGSRRASLQSQFSAAELERMNRDAEFTAQEAGHVHNESEIEVGAARGGTVGGTIDAIVEGEELAGSDSAAGRKEAIRQGENHGGLGERNSVDNPQWPGQPKPLGPPPTGDADRQELANFRWEERYVVDEKVLKALSAEDEKKLIEFRILAKRAKRETFVGDEQKRFEELIATFKAKLQPQRVALNADEVQGAATKARSHWGMRFLVLSPLCT